MHLAIVLGVFLVVGAAVANHPYNARITCRDGLGDCAKININKHLNVSAFHATFSARNGHLSLVVFCEVMNLSDSSWFIDRSAFSAISSGDIKFTRMPFKIAKGFKGRSMPDNYEVLPDLQQDYVFIFRSTDRYTKRQIKQALKKDSFYFVRQNGRQDTLFSVVPDDKRIENIVDGTKRQDSFH